MPVPRTSMKPSIWPNTGRKALIAQKTTNTFMVSSGNATRRTLRRHRLSKLEERERRARRDLVRNPEATVDGQDCLFQVEMDIRRRGDLKIKGYKTEIMVVLAPKLGTNCRSEGPIRSATGPILRRQAIRSITPEMSLEKATHAAARTP